MENIVLLKGKNAEHDKKGQFNIFLFSLNS